MRMLFEELKRRKVFRVAAIYAVVAWVLIQVSDVVLPTFGAPAWVNQTIIFLFILGIFPTLIAAWAYELTPEGIRPDSTAQPQVQVPAPQSQRLIYATFILLLLAVGFQVADRFYFSERQILNQPLLTDSLSNSANTFQGSINLSHGLVDSPRPLPRTFLNLTPDGSRLIYTAYQSDNTHQLLLRDLTTLETKVLLDGYRITEAPRISPDGTQIVVPTDADLLIVGIENSVTRSIDLNRSNNSAVAWLSDNELVYPDLDINLRRKSLVDGSDSAFGREARGVSPWVLPGANSFIFATIAPFQSNSNFSDIKLYDINSGTSKTIVRGGYFPKYAQSGHITFIREGNLWAVPFDLDTLELAGSETLVVSGVHSQPIGNSASYTLSSSGRLVYLADSTIADATSPSYYWGWVYRSGREEEIKLEPPGVYTDPEISPDGQSLMFTKIEVDDANDIWVYDISSGSTGRRSFTGKAHNSKWNPDGTRFFYQLGGGSDPAGIWSMNADGSGEPTLIYSEPEKTLTPAAFINNGEQLLYMDGLVSSRDINVLTFTDGGWVSTSLINTPFNNWTASVSPNGHWIAYESNRNGKFDVFVNSYPELGLPRQVSIQSGREPKWSAKGNELFYLRTDGTLMSVKVTAENDFTWESPVPIASGFLIFETNSPNYSVSPDGQRFVRRQVIVENSFTDTEPTHANLTIFENWFEELRRLAPPDSR